LNLEKLVFYTGQACISDPVAENYTLFQNDIMNDSIWSPRTILIRGSIAVMLAVAFGYIEAAVVVYLRQIFHPNGFSFPLPEFILSDSSRDMLMTEVGREAATLVLILCVSLLAGTNIRQRTACFMIIFAVWDIFFYVWLKVLLGWPASLLDWDILFLIPLPWAGPVLAPIIVSLVMLIFAVIILYRDYLSRPVKLTGAGRFLFCLAGLIIIISFCTAGHYATQTDYASHFSWLLFFAGLVIAAIAFTQSTYRITS
jgi:hypothetical protein